MLKMSFSPVDTLFFRDGSPYNRHEIQANVNSIFPPSPTTLIGAIRAAWAKSMGWSGCGGWNEEIISKLGSHFSLPNGMTFDGPYLSKNEELFFPVPAHLMGVESIKSGGLEKPSDLVFLGLTDSYETDLGKVFLPSMPSGKEGLKPLNENWWVSSEGMTSILKGELPNTKSLVHRNQLWIVEQRIGNYSRENETRTTGLNSLYSPQHIRLQQGVELVMFSTGLQEHAKCNEILTPVGGEARMCELRVKKESISEYLNISIPVNDQNKQVLIALTPIRLERGISPGSEIGSGVLKSMCNARPTMLGGWSDGKPRQLEPCLPAGTVLFLEAEQPKLIGDIQIIGKDSSWGFGRLVTGQRL